MYNGLLCETERERERERVAYGSCRLQISTIRATVIVHTYQLVHEFEAFSCQLAAQYGDSGLAIILFWEKHCMEVAAPALVPHEPCYGGWSMKCNLMLNQFSVRDSDIMGKCLEFQIPSSLLC